MNNRIFLQINQNLNILYSNYIHQVRHCNVKSETICKVVVNMVIKQENNIDIDGGKGR